MVSTLVMKIYKNSKSGFTLMELAVSLAIFTSITGIAAATYGNYVRNAKIAEANLGVRSLFDAAVVYHNEKKGKDHRLTETATRRSERFQFPYLRTKPSGKRQRWFEPPKGKKANLVCFKPNLRGNRWSPYVDCDALNFSLDSPTYYVYQISFDPYFKQRPEKPRNRRYTLRVSARGDLDGDGKWSLFERAGGIGANNNLYFDTGIYSANPEE